MAAADLEKRVKQLETQVAEIQSSIRTGDSASTKNWRRAVEQFAGDEDLLAVFAEAKKLREAERKSARQRRTRRPKT